MSAQKEQSFEEMLARLEEIVKALDSVETPLDSSLALFEEGAGLVKRLSDTLDKAQQKVVLLTQGPDGITEEPLKGRNE